jgi:transposase
MTNTVIFNDWVETFLCPELKHWDIIVLDNASFHKSERTRELIETRGAKLLYLPPYSPDLNPIENYWAILKQYVRKYNTSFEVFYTVLDEFLCREEWSRLS